MAHISKVVVRYAETDQMGIVHHSHYPVWYEVARTDFIKKIGLTYTEMERMGIMLPLLDLRCRYLRPAYYEDVLQVEARISALRRVKMEFSYTIRRNGDDRPLNTGSTMHGIVDKNMKPINLEQNFPQIYTKLASLIEPECN